ncbi:hypothetical protein [Kribbella sp. NPDC051718]|uniref:hypothetical protein n=1 Tax=Kribbella sp. NPDC051718 TaxID=3155168 RepID=UPI00342C7F7D
MKDNDGTVIGSTRRGLRRRGVMLRPRLSAVDGRIARFNDGTTTSLQTIVWATGFFVDDVWIQIPQALDHHGRLNQHRGITTVPGLFTLGRAWQHTIGSALLGFVQHDAAWLSQQITGKPPRPVTTVALPGENEPDDA